KKESIFVKESQIFIRNIPYKSDILRMFILVLSPALRSYNHKMSRRFCFAECIYKTRNIFSGFTFSDRKNVWFTDLICLNDIIAAVECLFIRLNARIVYGNFI